MVAVPKILGTYTAQHNKHIPALESQRNTIYCKHGTSLCEHGYGKKESALFKRGAQTVRPLVVQ